MNHDTPLSLLKIVLEEVETECTCNHLVIRRDCLHCRIKAVLRQQSPRGSVVMAHECPGCGVLISIDSDWCGECICKEDSL